MTSMPSSTARGPWNPDRTRLVSKGRFVVRLRPGEDPGNIHSHRDVAHGAALAAIDLDGGRVDAAVRRFSPAMRVTRAYGSAKHVRSRGLAHRGWNDLEESIGLSRTFRVEVDPRARIDHLVDELRALSVVEMASPQYLCATPFDLAGKRFVDPDYAQTMIGAAEARAMEPGDVAVLIGLVDSGVDLDHPELLGRIRPGVDTVELTDDEMPHGLQLVPNHNPNRRRPMDVQGHGTACAGILVANGIRIPPGLAGFSSVIPAKALTAVKQSDREGLSAIGNLDDINHAVKTAVDLGAHVINLSFGTPASALAEHDPMPHIDVVLYALARNCVLVAASGNSGDEVPVYPAALPGVISVGAVGPNGTPSHFTSRGESLALCAPGEAIPVAGIDGYTHHDGTSFAAPMVAGACALIVARGLRYSTSISPATVRALLIASATPFASPREARGCGAGILDVPRALRAVDEAYRSPPEDFADGSASATDVNHRGASP